MELSLKDLRRHANQEATTEGAEEEDADVEPERLQANKWQTEVKDNPRTAQHEEDVEATGAEEAAWQLQQQYYLRPI